MQARAGQGGAGLPPAARFRVRWLGRVSFARALALQERLRADILEGHGRETLLLCEHDPVVTLGRSSDPAHVLLPAAELARRGVAVHAVSRGGGVTYHGPGQLVGYPVFRLRAGVIDHLERMAGALAEAVARWGIAARWKRDLPGLWVSGPVERPAKLCAFGVHVHRRVAIHGFALNVTTPPEDFAPIVPCGLSGVAVTSISACSGARPDVAQVAAAAALSFRRWFGEEDAPRAGAPARGEDSAPWVREAIARFARSPVSSTTT